MCFGAARVNFMKEGTIVLCDKILKNEEKAIFSLRSLYKQYGYLPFKMSKFEEYDLYVHNKDFLISDNVITFNDTNGKLLALKPDVTLSIIKNTVDEEGCKQKVYYNENVYRVSQSTHQFKEIMQTGLECIGDIDTSDVFEVVYLAAKSLSTVSPDFMLDIAHMGIFSAVLDGISDSKLFKGDVARLVCEKNKHELLELCERYSVSEADSLRILAFIDLYGDMTSVMDKLSAVCNTEAAKVAYGEFLSLCTLLSKTEFKDNIRIDFSVINNTSYYDGVVFKGFLMGIYESVLSGGKYDPLMRRMGKRSSAIGFAIYLDQLEGFNSSASEYDVDVLLIYSDNTPMAEVVSARRALVENGKTVSAQKRIPEKLRYKDLIDLTKEGRK